MLLMLTASCVLDSHDRAVGTVHLLAIFFALVIASVFTFVAGRIIHVVAFGQ
jgi:uncharacterized membrane protein